MLLSFCCYFVRRVLAHIYMADLCPILSCSCGDRCDLKEGVEEMVQAHRLAEEAERAALAELETALTAKQELKSSLQREQEACQGLCAELGESRDRQVLL